MSRPSDHKAWTVTGVVILVTTLALAAGFAVALSDRHPDRLKAIALVAGICLGGSLGGWLAGRSTPADPGLAVAAGLGAVFLRVFPPLAALAWLRSAGRELCDHGAADWLLIFYLTLLATEILLHIMASRTAARRAARREN